MKRFIILANQRSGSTYLYKLLNNHPEILCLDEVFRKGANTQGNFTYYLKTNLNRMLLYKLFCNRYSIKLLPNNFIINRLTKNFIKEVLEKILDKNENVLGFKLMYDQFNFNVQLQDWIKNENVSIIHLIRKNVLKIHLSWLTRLKRGIPHSDKKLVPVKVWLDPYSIIDILKEIEDRQKTFKSKLSSDFDNKFLGIYYEDLLKDYSIELKKIFSFLNIKKCDVKIPSMKKLNPNDIKKIIENYDEINQKLINNNRELYLKL